MPYITNAEKIAIEQGLQQGLQEGSLKKSKKNGVRSIACKVWKVTGEDH